MKKYLPFILLAVGLLVVLGVFFVVRGGSDEAGDEKQLVELSPDEKPYITLTPEEDGHWLNLTVDKLESVVSSYDAKSLDYELVYTADSGTQGVPGSINLTDASKIERRLLLGSESSGKFRYDEGVTGGKITLSFRNEDRKLITRLSTDFAMSEGEGEINVPGTSVSYNSDTEDAFFVALGVLGYPADPPGEIEAGAVGIFSTSDEFRLDSLNYPGNAYFWDGEWKEVGELSGFGIYIFTK